MIARSPEVGLNLQLLFLILVVVLLPAAATAQTSPVDRGRRVVVVAGAGVGTTWDDEGLLGRGPAVSAGVGVRLTERISLIALIDRVLDRDWSCRCRRLAHGR